MACGSTCAEKQSLRKLLTRFQIFIREFERIKRKASERKLQCGSAANRGQSAMLAIGKHASAPDCNGEQGSNTGRECGEREHIRAQLAETFTAKRRLGQWSTTLRF